MIQEPFSNEKREHLRFPINLPISYYNYNEGTTLQSKTSDISAKGMCIVTANQLTPGTYLDIYLNMVDNGEKIIKKAKVVWSKFFDLNICHCGLVLENEKIDPIPIVLKTLISRKIEY